VSTPRVAWSIVDRFLILFAAAPPTADHTAWLALHEAV
jgi:hypothetical protein